MKLILAHQSACSGICLTVTEKGPHNDGSYFNVDVSDETLSRTTAKNWKNNSLINLERSLKFGDEMGGHLSVWTC